MFPSYPKYSPAVSACFRDSDQDHIPNTLQFWASVLDMYGMASPFTGGKTVAEEQDGRWQQIQEQEQEQEQNTVPDQELLNHVSLINHTSRDKTPVS